MEYFSIVILDTNFLLIPIQYKINIFEEIKSLIEGVVYYLILPEIFHETALKANDDSNKKFRREVLGALEFYKKQKEIYGDIIIELKTKPHVMDGNSTTLIPKSDNSEMKIGIETTENSMSQLKTGFLEKMNSGPGIRREMDYYYYSFGNKAISNKILEVLNNLSKDYNGLKINDVDDILLLASERLKGIFKRVYIATNDKELRRRARSRMIQTIVLYQKKILKVL